MIGVKMCRASARPKGVDGWLTSHQLHYCTAQKFMVASHTTSCALHVCPKKMHCNRKTDISTISKNDLDNYMKKEIDKVGIIIYERKQKQKNWLTTSVKKSIALLNFQSFFLVLQVVFYYVIMSCQFEKAPQVIKLCDCALLEVDYSINYPSRQVESLRKRLMVQ